MIKKSTIAALSCIAISLAACSQSSNDDGPRTAVVEATKVAAPEVTQPLAQDAVQQMSIQTLATVKPGTAACAFDSVDGNYSATQVKLDKSSAHVFRGWALGEDKQPAKTINFVLNGAESFVIAAKNGVDRPDVGRYFKNTSLSGAGFNFSTSLVGIPSGEYKVAIITRLGDVLYSCKTDKSITIF